MQAAQKTSHAVRAFAGLFAAMQAAQKLDATRSGSRSEFAAMQAAQKERESEIQDRVEFAAMQAAQKQTTAPPSTTITFAAMQAAQKNKRSLFGEVQDKRDATLFHVFEEDKGAYNPSISTILKNKKMANKRVESDSPRRPRPNARCCQERQRRRNHNTCKGTPSLQGKDDLSRHLKETATKQFVQYLPQ